MTPSKVRDESDAANLRTAREYIRLDPQQFPALHNYAVRVLLRLGTEKEKAAAGEKCQ